MKKLFWAGAAAMLLFAACQKEETMSASGTFNIGSESYTQGSTGGASGFTVTGSRVSVTGYNNTGNGAIEFQFAPGSALPPAGSYKVVSADSTPHSGEVYIVSSRMNTSGGSDFTSTGDGVTLVLSTSNAGKVTINVPLTKTRTVGTGAASTLSANVIQP